MEDPRKAETSFSRGPRDADAQPHREAAATHQDECAKDYATLLAEDAAWEDSGAQGSFGVHGCLYTLNGDAGDALLKSSFLLLFSA